MKRLSHVHDREICQRGTGSCPKPWSISVILSTGFKNQNTSESGRALGTSAKTCPDEGASFTALGYNREREREWESVCSCRNMHADACVYTGSYTLSSNKAVQHVSCVLTGGNVRSSSGGIQTDDVVLLVAWSLHVKPTKKMVLRWCYALLGHI